MQVFQLPSKFSRKKKKSLILKTNTCQSSLLESSPWGIWHHGTVLQCMESQLCLMISTLNINQGSSQVPCSGSIPCHKPTSVFCSQVRGCTPRLQAQASDILPTSMLTAQRAGPRVINPSVSTMHRSGTLGADELS